MRSWCLALISVIALPFSGARADDWAAPEPRSFHARGFGFVAEIFPPRSRQNDGDRPYCYLYQMEYAGTTWTIAARLRWQGQLVNRKMPYEAILSMDGQLVTLNDWGHVGSENAVVIYDRGGKLVKSYALEQFLPQTDMDKFSSSVSSRWWNKGAKYYFISRAARLYIVLPWGSALEFSLTNGQVRYGAANTFPGLKTADGNAETEVWATSLRFSSVTDLLQARKSK